MGKMSSICVRYKFVDGWHIFQSDELLGLYVANLDPKIAYDDVQASIEKLIYLNEGIRCSVIPETTYAEFISAIKDRAHRAVQNMLSNKRYLVSLAQ